MKKFVKAVNEAEKIIIKFLNKHGNSYKNKHGVNFALDCTGKSPRVTTRLMLYQSIKPTANKSISLFMGTTSQSIFDFILEFGIWKVASFYRFKPEDIQEMYLNNYACSEVTYYHYEPKKNAEDILLNFRISGETTFVSSPALHFYDEIPGKMHTVSEFQQYIKSHKQLLDWLVDTHAKLKSNFPKKFKLK